MLLYLAFLIIFLSFSNFCVFMSGYDIMSKFTDRNLRFSKMKYDLLGKWAPFLFYPQKSKHKSIFLIAFDLQRISIFHLLIDIMIIPLYLFVFYRCTHNDTYSISFAFILPMADVMLLGIMTSYLRIHAGLVLKYSSKQIAENEIKKHIKKCTGKIDTNIQRFEIWEKERKIWPTTITKVMVNVYNRETDHCICSNCILKLIKCRYYNGIIAQSANKKSSPK